jgi:predicted nucleotidyltransferase
MGVTIPKGLLIAGYRPAAIKQALQSFKNTGRGKSFVDLKASFPNRRDGAICLEECFDRGLMELDEDGDAAMTLAGEIIASAKATPRTPLAKAMVTLNELLDRAEKLNNDPEGVQFVEHIWLFGSVMRKQETVGDIDVAIITKRRPEYHADINMMKRHLDGVLSRRNDVPQARGLMWWPEHWVTKKALFGAITHPLLRGAQMGTSDLAGLGVPCQLIFDRSRGGRVNDPILDRHPESNGRDNTIDPPAQMPDLAPTQELRPMDGRWLAAFEHNGWVCPHEIFRSWTDEARRLFSNPPYRFRVVTDATSLGDSWKPKRTKSSGLDGRNNILIMDVDDIEGASFVLRRSVDITPKAWTLRVGLEDFQAQRKRTAIEAKCFFSIITGAVMILAVDAERLLRRSAETPEKPDVYIRIESNAADWRLPHAEEWMQKMLSDRLVRIEPEGWAGPKVSIGIVS